MEIACVVEVAKVVGEEVAMYRLPLIERKVQGEAVVEESVKASWGPVEEAMVRAKRGVLVPIPTTPPLLLYMCAFAMVQGVLMVKLEPPTMYPAVPLKVMPFPAEMVEVATLETPAPPLLIRSSPPVRLEVVARPV
jgi:hypothetical protein